MKYNITTSCLMGLMFLFLGCKKSSENVNISINKPLLIGTWKPVPNQFDYNSRTFKKDSLMQVDGSNLGFSFKDEKWWWGGNDTLYFTWGGTMTNVPYFRVIKLTTDSFVVYYEKGTKQFRYYRQ